MTERKHKGGVWKRKRKDGTTGYLAVVSVKGFKRATKAFDTMAEARAWADALDVELRKQSKAGSSRPDLSTLTIRGLLEEYLKDPEVTALRTFDDIESLLGWWINHRGGDRALGFGTVQLREARDLLRNGRAAGTVNRHLSALRSAWNWGRAAGFIPQEKVWPTRLLLTEPRERVRFLSDAELTAVLEAAEKYSPMMYAAVVTSLATGVRMGELLRLEWKDLDFERHTVTVHISKNTRRRTVHLPDPAIAALKQLKREGVVSLKRVFLQDDGEPATKDYLSYRWKVIRATAKLSDFKWHDLRHSCASYLAQAGATLVEIGSVLGHSSPSITAKYAHLVAGAPVTGSAALADKLRGKP